MALPTRGQADWDDEMNSHISGLTADVANALANVTVAVSNANDARNTAQAVKTAVIGPADVTTAGFVNDTASSTRGALNATYARERARNIADFNLSGVGAAAALQAAHDDMAGGGIIVVPEGTWDATGTSGVIITKPVEIRGQSPAYEFSPTRLRFPAASKGITVQLGNSGEGFRITDLALIGQATGAVAGAHGLHLKMCRPYLNGVTVYGFGGHGVFYDGTAGGNVNHGLATGLRCYGNRGDGIRTEGTDANALTFINPDVVANYGYGINNMGGHNLFLHPHADQQYNGSPGAYRDNGLSNRWEMVYEESAKAFLIDSGSSAGYVSISTFGPPTITTSGSAHTVWEIVRVSGSRNRLRTSNGTKQWQAGVGLVGTNTFDITNETDGTTFMSVAADVSEVAWRGHQMPQADATYDFGWTGARWRDAHLSRWMRLKNVAGAGELFLRNNGGVLEKSTDGSSWSAV